MWFISKDIRCPRSTFLPANAQINHSKAWLETITVKPLAKVHYLQCKVSQAQACLWILSQCFFQCCHADFGSNCCSKLRLCMGLPGPLPGSATTKTEEIKGRKLVPKERMRWVGSGQYGMWQYGVLKVACRHIILKTHHWVMSGLSRVIMIYRIFPFLSVFLSYPSAGSLSEQIEVFYWLGMMSCPFPVPCLL